MTAGRFDAVAGGWSVFWNELLMGRPPTAIRGWPLRSTGQASSSPVVPPRRNGSTRLSQRMNHSPRRRGSPRSVHDRGVGSLLPAVSQPIRGSLAVAPTLPWHVDLEELPAGRCSPQEPYRPWGQIECSGDGPQCSLGRPPRVRRLDHTNHEQAVVISADGCFRRVRADVDLEPHCASLPVATDELLPATAWTARRMSSSVNSLVSSPPHCAIVCVATRTLR